MEEQEQSEFFNMLLAGVDKFSAIAIINQGIDSRLEGFTKSKFAMEGHRLKFDLHLDEIQIFIRRLLELDDLEAGRLADDVIYVYYGVENL